MSSVSGQDENRELLTSRFGEGDVLIRRSRRSKYWALAKALFNVFCWPPVPSRIVAKLAFAPPSPVGYTFTDGDTKLLLLNDTTGIPTVPFQPRKAKLSLHRIKASSTGVSFDGDNGDGEITCMYLRRESSKFTILLSHGNAEDLGYLANFMYALSTKLNCSVFGYDYPGYGLSTGVVSERNLYNSIQVAWNFLQLQMGVPAQQIVLYGVSIGTAPTVYLASKLAKRFNSDTHESMPAGVVLHSPIASGLRMFRPSLSVTFCCDPFKNASRIATILTPTLIIHGTHDEVIPVSHSYNLHADCNAAVDPLFIESGGHNDLDSFPVFYTRLQNYVNDLEKRRRLMKIESVANHLEHTSATLP